jgi:hypothetical protein
MNAGPPLSAAGVDGDRRGTKADIGAAFVGVVDASYTGPFRALGTTGPVSVGRGKRGPTPANR